MQFRRAAGALVVSLAAFAQPLPALADPPAPPAASAPSPPPAAPAAPPAAAPRGAIVVAVGDDAAAAARSLAFDAYRDADLRPPIDDATARVLAGGAPADDASPRLKEIAELRGSIARAGSDLVARRLLASLGAELSAP